MRRLLQFGLAVSSGRLRTDARRLAILPSRSNQNGAPRLIAAMVSSQPTRRAPSDAGEGIGITDREATELRSGVDCAQVILRDRYLRRGRDLPA